MKKHQHFFVIFLLVFIPSLLFAGGGRDRGHSAPVVKEIPVPGTHVITTSVDSSPQMDLLASTVYENEEEGVFTDFTHFSVSPQSGSYSINTTDLNLGGINGSRLQISRRYSPSEASGESGRTAEYNYNYPEIAYNLGSGWRLSLPYASEPRGFSIDTDNWAIFENNVSIVLPSGASYQFKELELVFVSGTKHREYVNVTQNYFRVIVDTSNWGTEYTLVMADGTRYVMDGDGLVRQITHYSSGHVSDTISVGIASRLITDISDSFGRKLKFSYVSKDSIRAVDKITVEVNGDATGTEINYSYGSNRLLETVTVSGDAGATQKVWTYGYKTDEKITLKRKSSAARSFYLLNKITSPTGQVSEIKDYETETFYTDNEAGWNDRLLITQLTESVRTPYKGTDLVETKLVDYYYYKARWNGDGEGEDAREGSGDDYIAYAYEEEKDQLTGSKRVFEYVYSPGKESRTEAEAKKNGSTYTVLSSKKLFDPTDGYRCLGYQKYIYTPDTRTLQKRELGNDPYSPNKVVSEFSFDGRQNVIQEIETTTVGELSTVKTTWREYWGSDRSLESQFEGETLPADWPADAYPDRPEHSESFPANLVTRQVVQNSWTDWDGIEIESELHSHFDYDGSTGNRVGSAIYDELRNGGEWLRTATSYYTEAPIKGFPQSIMKPSGFTTTQTYHADDENNTYIITTTSSDDVALNWSGGTSSNQIVTKKAIDLESGKTAWSMDGRGYVTEFNYDALGRTISIVMPDVNSPDVTYVDPSDMTLLNLGLVDADDEAFQTPEDSGFASRRANNPQVTSEYDDVNLITTTTDPMGRISKTHYNSVNRPVAKCKLDASHPLFDSITETFEYDGWGRVVSHVSAPNGSNLGDFISGAQETKISYDLRNRPLEVTLPDGELIRSEYGLVNNGENEDFQIIQTDERGFVTYVTKDPLGRVIEVIQDSRVSKKGYDALGNLRWESRGNASGTEKQLTRYEYNALGQLVKVISPVSNHYDMAEGSITGVSPTVSFLYDVDGNKIQESSSITATRSRTTHYKVDGLGRVYEQSISYDESSAFSDAETQTAVTQFHMDGEGNQIEIIDAEGNSSCITYSPSGLPAESEDAEGNRQQSRYYNDGQLAIAVDPRGVSGNPNYSGLDFSTVYRYDGYGLLSSTELPIDPYTSERSTTENEYYPNGKLYRTVVNEGDGGEVRYAYDERSNIVLEERIGGTVSYLTRYEYDESGNRIRVIGSGGIITSTAYDRWRQPVKIFRDMGDTRAFEYDVFGNLVGETDGNGNMTTNTYDNLNRLTMSEKAVSNKPQIHRYFYDMSGNLSRSEDAEGRQIKTLYDERGSMIAENKFGILTYHRYDLNGNLLEELGGDNKKTVYEYDAANRPTEISYYDNGVFKTSISNTYDESGFAVESSEGGVTTRYNHDDAGIYRANPFGRIEREETLIDGRLFKVDYKYDLEGRLASYTDPSGVERTLVSNELGELKSIPGIIDAPIQYDASGLLSSYSLSNGVSLSQAYDDNGRLINRAFDVTANTDLSWTYNYDDNDNIQGWNERIYIYDEKDQMLSERRVENLSSPVPSAIGYLQNDLQGTDSVGLFPLSDQMVTLDYNAGSIGLALNSIVEVAQITLTPGSPVHRVDAESLKVFISDDDTSYTEYEGWFLRKDPESGALELVFPEPVLTQYLKIHCTFDERHPDLSAVALDESSCKASFQAPAAQMVQVYTMESVEAEDLMEYDGVGNRISEAEIRDNLRADYAGSFYSETLFLRTNGSSGANGRYGYEYDERGNLIGKGEFYLEGSDPQGPVSVDMSQGERWSYEWDNLNRLVRVEHNGALSASYTYSPRGLRVKKSASSILYFVYDLSGQLIYESDGSSYTSYVHAFGKHLARFDGSVDASGNHTPTDTYFYHTDHVGTVNGVSDMSGTVVWEASYTAFGEVINITGLLEQRAIFGGKGYDSDSALYYFNARWYDPENGRFISEDPARDGVNWYAYVGNNPLKYTDPSGMWRTKEERQADRAERKADRLARRLDRAQKSADKALNAKTDFGRKFYTQRARGWADLADDTSASLSNLTNRMSGDEKGGPSYNDRPEDMLSSLDIIDLYGIETFKELGDLEFFLPVQNRPRMTTGFGWDPVVNGGRWHPGWDLAGPRSWSKIPIYAASSGFVQSGRGGGYGVDMNIRYDEPWPNDLKYTGPSLTTHYSHLLEGSIKHSPGDFISKGEGIAYMGSTGNSTARHLHYEVRLDGKAIDPHIINHELAGGLTPASGFSANYWNFRQTQNNMVEQYW